MPVEKLKSKLIHHTTLEKLVDERLMDFDALMGADRHAAAIYLAGYAVECLLKARICITLDLEELQKEYEKHDLLFLLLHSGLHRRIQVAEGGKVFDNLKNLDGIWNPTDRERNIRFADDPFRYDKETALKVRSWLMDAKDGVLTWLQNPS